MILVVPGSDLHINKTATPVSGKKDLKMARPLRIEYPCTSIQSANDPGIFCRGATRRSWWMPTNIPKSFPDISTSIPFEPGWNLLPKPINGVAMFFRLDGRASNLFRIVPIEQ